MHTKSRLWGSSRGECGSPSTAFKFAIFSLLGNASDVVDHVLGDVHGVDHSAGCHSLRHQARKQTAASSNVSHVHARCIASRTS